MRHRTLTALLLALTLAWPAAAVATPAAPSAEGLTGGIAHVAEPGVTRTMAPGVLVAEPARVSTVKRAEVSAQSDPLDILEYTWYEWEGLLFIDIVVYNDSTTVDYNDVYAEVELLTSPGATLIDTPGAYSSAWAAGAGDWVTVEIVTQAPVGAYTVGMPAAYGEPDLYDVDPVELTWLDAGYESQDDGTTLWWVTWRNDSGQAIEAPSVFGPAYDSTDSMIFVADALWDGTRIAPGDDVTTWFYTYADSTDYAGDAFRCQAMPFDGDELTETEIAGRNRIETAIAAAREGFPAGADTVLITTGYNWPDALSGSGLAGLMGAPILLTSPTTLSSGITGILTELGASQVIVLGSEAAVSRQVAGQLASYFGTEDAVIRLGGRDRYETSRIIANFMMTYYQDYLPGYEYDGTGFVATGMNFPDALAASPIAAYWGYPVYLVNPRGLDSATASTMSTNGLNQAFVLGSPDAVPDMRSCGRSTPQPARYADCRGATGTRPPRPSRSSAATRETWRGIAWRLPPAPTSRTRWLVACSRVWTDQSCSSLQVRHSPHLSRPSSRRTAPASGRSATLGARPQ